MNRIQKPTLVVYLPAEAGASGSTEPRLYRSPTLVDFGQLLGLTFGGSPGAGDSGGGGLIQNPLG